MDDPSAEWRFDNLILALGASNWYHIAGKKARFHEGQPILQYVASGPSPDCYYICVQDKLDKSYSCTWGTQVPAKLKAWLEREVSDQRQCKRVRVVFGPDDSFFAWDDQSMRWSNLPCGLEDTLQSWLTAQGWKYGPPKCVTLGCNGSYFISTAENMCAFDIPEQLGEVSRAFERIKSAGKAHSVIKYVSLSSYDPSQYIIVLHSREVVANCPRLDKLHRVLDYTYPTEARKLRKRTREEERRCSEQKRSFSEDTEGDEPRKRRRTSPPCDYSTASTSTSTASASNGDDSSTRERNQEAATLFDIWDTQCQTALNGALPIDSFPAVLTPPSARCPLSACADAKQKSRLRACRHEVEALLRASGRYSADWLRRRRTMWHPDYFGRRCDPAFRGPLCETSTELFIIFEALITAEQQQQQQQQAST